MTIRRYSGVLLGALALGSSAAQASELSYTFVDFGALAVDGSVSGTKEPTATQRVDVASADGDGLSVSGSLAVGRRFFVAGGYWSSVVDANALVVSPLATAAVTISKASAIATAVATPALPNVGRCEALRPPDRIS